MKWLKMFSIEASICWLNELSDEPEIAGVYYFVTNLVSR